MSPTEAIDVIGKRDGVVGLVSEKIARRIVLEGTLAVLGCIGKVPDVAIAFEDQVRTWGKIHELLAGGFVGVGRVPDRPQG